MEKRCHSRMMLGQFWLSVRTSFVAVTKPALLVARCFRRPPIQQNELVRGERDFGHSRNWHRRPTKSIGAFYS